MLSSIVRSMAGALWVSVPAEMASMPESGARSRRRRQVNGAGDPAGGGDVILLEQQHRVGECGDAARALEEILPSPTVAAGRSIEW
jgi:hypothetical protein